MGSFKDRWLEGYYNYLTWVGLIALVFFFCRSVVQSPPEKPQKPDCFYSEFYLPNEGLTACCKKAIITYCGATLAFCEGQIPMFVCQQNVSCLNGELCQNVPNWMKK
jgi:hypothetical protein